MKIALDAGHSTRRPGAQGGGLHEEVLTEYIVERMGHYVRQAGHEPVFTRNDNLLIRAVTAVREQCDGFLCVHINAASDPMAHGTESYYRLGDDRSAVIAKRLIQLVVQNWNAKPDPPGSPLLVCRKAKPDTQSQHSGGLAVLKGTWRTMPAVLWEVCFISNPNDQALLRNAHFLERMACEGVNSFILQLDLLRQSPAQP